MREIPLSRGKFALVDDEDFAWLNQWKWYCNYYGYAVRDKRDGKNRQVVFMHRVANQTPRGLRTDHVNRNTLDNRKENLRSVTGSQNGMNRGLNRNNTSGFRGIIWRKDTRKWQARIKHYYKTIYLGCFDNIRRAIEVRKAAEILYS